MTCYLNNLERNNIKVMAPRKIQQEAIEHIIDTVLRRGRKLINMPCRTGKTFTTIYSLNKAGIDLIIVLCGKASAKTSYETDSTWIDPKTGKIDGYNRVIVNNKAIKNFFETFVINAGDKLLIEVTPQLLNKHPEFVEKLAELAQTMNAVFVFDEAHFTEQTAKTKDMVATITDSSDEDILTEETLKDFKTIPWIYLTASPDTQSLQKVFSTENENYYEVTKEMEIELYQQDLLRPVEEREFNYVPVRNCLYVMNHIMDSIFDSSHSAKQDFTSLFTLPLSRPNAEEFVLKSLTKAITIIKQGPGVDFMKDDFAGPTYTRRGSNINLMIKVAVNSKKTNKSDKSVAEHVADCINEVKDELLETFSEFSGLNILDATQTNNISQDQANKFFDSNPYTINIILTQQRLIEGTTLYNLDGFLYYCTAGTLVKYKQESGRTLTPSTNKTFGFIFFFDETALANVREILLNKLNNLKKKKKHGPRRLTADQAAKFTRINPAFIEDGNEDLKLIDYSKSLLTKSDIEKKRVKENLFNKERLLQPDIFELIKSLLTKCSGNTTKTIKTKVTSETSEADSSSKSASTSSKSSKKKSISPDTKPEEIEIEKLVNTIMYMYQDCVQNDIDADQISDNLITEAEINNLPTAVLTKFYEDEDLYFIMMDIYAAMSEDQGTINPEDNDND